MIGAIAAGVMVIIGGASAAQGDPEQGEQVFRACIACHSLEPGKHRTGPSLAGIWGENAGTVEGFSRYSPALKSTDVTWTAETLDAWLADPRASIPGNRMIFPGLKDSQARADLIAYLKVAAAGGDGPPDTAGQDGMMGGGMARSDMPDLKAIGPDQQVTAIRYCGDTYHVTTAAGETLAGETLAFWEFNLRFKTDSSEKGPSERRPALLPASSMGDRAFVIFAHPSEISSFIEKRC